MIRLFKFILIFLSIGTLYFSCDRLLDEVAPTTFEYYPIESGKYRIYQVDSVVYDEYNCTMHSSTFFIKEETGQAVLDGEGDTMHSVRRYIKEDSSAEWTLLNIWSEKIEDNQLQRVENNQRFIKLVFPAKENTSWDGIVFIRRDTLVAIRGGSIDQYKDWDDFTMKNVGETFLDTISNVIYPDALLVEQVDKINNIEKRFSREVFSKEIGMVYKEMWILDTQCRINCTGVGDIASCLFTPWKEKAEKGYILTMSLIDHNY